MGAAPYSQFMGLRLGGVALVAVLICGGFVFGRMTQAPALDDARSRLAGKDAALKASSSELAAKEARLTAVSAESEATKQVATDLYVKNRELEGKAASLERQLREAQSRPVLATSKTVSPCADVMVDFMLADDLRRSAKAINPATTINPPAMDPFGEYALAVSRASKLLGQAADALDRYEVACEGR